MNGLYDEFRVALHSIWTRRWLALAIAWAICVLGWLVIAMIPNSYQSRARLLVDVNTILPEAAGASPYSNKQQIEQIINTMTSARNLEKVAVTTGLVPAGSSDRDKADAVAMLQKKITVLSQKDNIYEITADMSVGSLSDAENAKLSSNVVDSLITVFRDEQLRGGRMNAKEGLKFLDGQIASREIALREAEAKRTTFEAKYIGMLPGAGGSGMRIDTARSELNQIEGQIAAASGALAAANGQLASTPATISVPGLNSTGGGVARQQLGGAQAELSSMRARGLTDAHPDVIALKNQIAALQAQASREGSGGGGNSTTQNPAYGSLVAMRAERQATVSALSSRKAVLQAEIAQITAKRIEEPGIAAEYDRITGDYNVLKDQYDKLLAQRENIRLRGQMESETDAIRVDLVDPPTKPRTPAAPNRPLMLMLVLVAGVGGGIGGAFALGQIRTSYPTAARLERASGLPVIGSITEVVTDARRADRKKKLVWLAGGSGALVALFFLLLAVEFFQRGMVA